MDLTHERGDRKQDLRLLEARLKLVIDSLTATILFNPAGILLACVAVYAGRSVFGYVPAANFAAAIGLHLTGAALTWTVRRRLLRKPPRDLRKTEWILIALQGVLALAWGACGWLLWSDANAANNIFIAVVLLIVVFSNTLLRSTSRGIFLTGTLVMTSCYAFTLAAHHGVAAGVLLAMIPFWTVYIVAVGEATKRRVDDLLRAQFANEDMSVALRLAHDDALRKRFEAESANASKTAFLANMSHELRTPLNAILGFSDIIAEQVLGPDNPRYRDYARDINASGSHLLDLINDILDVAKIESGKMEIDAKPLDMSLTLAGIERQMALRVREKKLHLAVTIDADAPSPIADERAFKQIALNLISNAVKFTPEAGRIDVVCRRGENEGFLLAVEDSGQGIPPDKLDTVFDAFSQIDNRYDRKAGGTGLGLAMVQGLARLHGGNAWIESRVGQGTKVFVYFPLAIDRQRRAVSAHG